MLYLLGEWLQTLYGPFRLFTSSFFLAGVGTALAALLTWWLLPRFWDKLPRDRGRAHAVNAAQSKGKPVGAGALFIPIFMLFVLLFVPPVPRIWESLVCVALATAVGFLDDKSGGWSEYKLAAADLGVAFLASLILCQFEPVRVWLPFIKEALDVPPWLYVPFSTGLIWVSINATNCTDGVDGLSGSLSGLAFLYMGIVLYAVVGHVEIAKYLLVPHIQDGSAWGIFAFLMVGCLGGYLWHNAAPSAVLMGDAGSRPLGLLLGVLVMASGNPFLILIVAGVVLVNGATGLVKVALLRFFKIGIFKSIRFPLHDHVRHVHGWSNTHVFVRFLLMQALITPMLLLFLLKIR